MPQHHRRWKFLAAILQAWRLFRTEGARAWWFWLLGSTVYRRLVLFEQRLQQPATQEPPRVPIEIGLLDRHAAAEYGAFRPGTNAGEFARRLEARHLCFAARWEGRLISASWVSTSSFRQGYLFRDIRLLEDEIYIYDIFTRPEYRGQGIATMVGTAVVRHFRGTPYRRMLRLVWPENRSAMSLAEKAGGRRVGVMGCVRLGRWRYHFYRGGNR